MKAEETAKELVEKMHKKMYSDGIYDASQCAIICCEEIINGTIMNEKELKFWPGDSDSRWWYLFNYQIVRE